MPLLDHFAYPLKEHRPWTGFHSAWANAISSNFNRQLPDGWFAGPEVHWFHEGDAVVIEETDFGAVSETDPLGGDGGIATLPVLAEPRRSLEYDIQHDVVEVRVVDERGGIQTLVGVVEIVSPGNKDRPESRESFLQKVEGYIDGGIGVCVIDIVTKRTRSLHRELLQRLGDTDPEADGTYAATYLLREEPRRRIDIWYEPLAIDSVMPDIPLPLKSGPPLTVALEETYLEACANYKISPEAVRAAIADRSASDSDAETA